MIRPNRGRYRFGKGICPVCGREIGLTRGGIFRRHVKELGGKSERCAGSWGRPVRITLFPSVRRK